MSDPEYLELDALLHRTLGALNGLDAADIGAGSGRVTRSLAALGANAVGVEPNADQAAQAQAEGGGPTYVAAPAEATGLAAQAFDLVVFSLSLHHLGDMAAGLREACRLTRPGGRVAVIEPVAPDPIHPVMRFIDDESAVYAAAQAALEDAVAEGALRRELTLRFASKYRIADADAMIADVIAIDSRRSLADADAPAFRAAFAAAHRTDDEGGYLPYWARIDVFARP